MSKIIDAAGKECPIPVIMAKKEIEENQSEFCIIVDNDIAVANLQKLANSKGYSIGIKDDEGVYTVKFTPGDHPSSGDFDIEDLEGCQVDTAPAVGGKWVVFVGKDHVGEGEAELGRNLMKMFLYTLSEEDALPDSLLFMNSGVKLASENDETAEHIKMIQERGTEVLVCGTCLDYYGLKDKLQAGEVSNMYEIAGRMFRAAKVVTV